MIKYSSYMLDFIDSDFKCEEELVHYIETTKYKIKDYNLDRYILEVSPVLYGIMQQNLITYNIRYVEKYRDILVSINEDLRSNEIRIKYERNDIMSIEFNTMGYGKTWALYKQNENKLPDKVQFNKKKKATTLIFDDDVVVVKQNKEDKEDYEKAFLWAYFIKKSGLSKTQASKYIDKIMEELK